MDAVNPTSTNLARGQDVYRAITRRKILILSGLSLALLFSIILDISIGPASLPLIDVFWAIVTPSKVEVVNRVIVWDIRMPIALMAVIVGSGLAIAGAQMQTILNNPLASPFTLGISAAASFGAALAIVLGIGVIPVAGAFLVSANAFAFAMLASLLIYFMSRLRGVTVETVILLGIALVFTFTSMLAFLQFIATEAALQEVVFWTLGSLLKANWIKIGIALAVIGGVIPFMARQAWALTAMRLGDDKARSLGVNVARIRIQILLLVSLIASVAVAFVGTIGFIGLVGPHVSRMLVGEDQRFFLPTAAVSGALLLSVTSIISKSIIPGVIFPVGIITSLVGVPFFLSIILSHRRQVWS